MNMWAYPPPSLYGLDRSLRQKVGAKKSKSTDTPMASKQTTNTNISSPPPPFSANNQIASNITDLLEPAIDGPPSPESIRALSKQMKRASALDKHQSHQTNSSGSSSLRSLASGDRPSWENALEGISSLSRKSSGRSTSSSMPSRERPESVQIFGKTIFNRRGKLRRENSAQSSSESSLYSPEATNEPVLSPTSNPLRDSHTPGNFFNRRRATRSESTDDSAAQRKFQISGPYNFQHVTHTQRDDLLRSNRATLASDFSQVRAPQVPNKMSRGIHPDDLSFTDFSSEAPALRVDVGSRSRNRASRPPSLMKKQTSPRRLIKHTKSQEQLRIPPPRPPRSPIEPDYQVAPPVPPPRISSRMSLRHDFDSQTSTDSERPLTSGGFRHPRPFGFSPDATSPPSTSYGFVSRSSLDALPEDCSPRLSTPPDDVNWPLPNPSSISYEAPLPGVPEEEENTILVRRSRASVASNSSSLRGSQSVPLLRQLSLSQSPEGKRPTSGASETLGRFDLFAAQRALKAALLDGSGSESVPRDSWEDDIDYCYEHEVEADCDYAWERPSLDDSRDSESLTPVEGDHHSDCSHGDDSPTMLTPAQFDMPALSPASQVSAVTVHEAITPTAAIPKASNFSLPRAESSHQQRFLHVKKPSDASSFKESHGFTLSPSLLIPNDFQQQMMASELDEPQDHHEPPFLHMPYEAPTLNMDTSALLVNSRISGSTTTSNESDPSGSERHVSTTSASTDFTRLTMSTSSLDMDSYIPKCDTVDQPPRVEEPEPFHVRAKSQGTMPILPESDVAFEPTIIRRDLTHGSDPNLVRLATEGDSRSAAKRKDQLFNRRRARTTSLSTPPPPGQYALFPSVHISGPRI